MEVNREELLDALTNVQAGLSTKDVVVQASYVIFDKDVIYTYNDEISVSCPFKHGLCIAVPSAQLSKLISKIPDGSIDIECTEDELFIKGEKIKATLRGKVPAVPLQDEEKPTAWEDVPKGFMEGMQYACMSTSADMAKPVLTCVHWTPDHIESCDNYRLTRYTVATDTLEENTLIPGNSVVALSKFSPISFCIMPGWTHFRMKDGCVFSCRVFEGEYANLDNFVNVIVGDSVVNFPAITSEVLDRVSILSAEDTANDSYAEIKIENKKLLITGTHELLGSISETARINCKVDIVFSVKIESLDHILRKFKKGYIAENASAIKFEMGNLVHVVALMEAV